MQYEKAGEAVVCQTKALEPVVEMVLHPIFQKSSREQVLQDSYCMAAFTELKAPEESRSTTTYIGRQEVVVLEYLL
jgi:hypothetical protein